MLFRSILGIQNALLIAIFAALINIVPYLGPMMGCTFAIFITISSNLGLDFYKEVVPMIVKVIAVFGFMQFLNDWIVQPLIFSNRVAAHPLEIFLVTLAGAKLGGIGGMILAIPAYTVVRIVAREFFNQYRIVQKITSSLDGIHFPAVYFLDDKPETAVFFGKQFGQILIERLQAFEQRHLVGDSNLDDPAARRVSAI